MTTQAKEPEYLPFGVERAYATFPDGYEGYGDKYSSQGDVSKFLNGKRIVAVEFTSCNTIKFVLDGGLSVSLVPCGCEGDDLELTIEQVG